MEERRVKSWVSLLCRAATEDGSIWDLLPMYTSLNQPPQDVMTHHAELDGSIACDGPILAHCLDRLSGCTRHTPCTKAVQHDPSGQQPGQIHHHQLRQPAKVSTQRHTLCNNATSNKFCTKLDTIHSTTQHNTAQHSTASLTCARLKLCSSLTCVSAMQAVEGCWFRQHAYTVTSRCQKIHS